MAIALYDLVYMRICNIYTYIYYYVGKIQIYTYRNDIIPGMYKAGNINQYQ